MVFYINFLNYAFWSHIIHTWCQTIQQVHNHNVYVFAVADRTRACRSGCNGSRIWYRPGMQAHTWQPRRSADVSSIQGWRRTPLTTAPWRRRQRRLSAGICRATHTSVIDIHRRWPIRTSTWWQRLCSPSLRWCSTFCCTCPHCRPTSRPSSESNSHCQLHDQSV